MSRALLDRFVATFVRAIRGEMDALRRRKGPFEVMLGAGELLDESEAGARYRFGLPAMSDKLMVGIECSLRTGTSGRDTLVTVEAIGGDSITLGSGGRIELGPTATLVVYPWFLYEKLIGALEGLSPESFEVQRALTLFGRGDVRRRVQPLQLDHGALNESQRAAVQLCSDSALGFIWGPPGTGKTRTLAHLVRELLAQGKRVLLVSTTNAAIDQALAQIATEADARQRIDRGEIVRLGRTEANTHGAAVREVVRRQHAGRADALGRMRERHRDADSKLRHLNRAVQRLSASEPGAQTSLFELPEHGLRATDLREVFGDRWARALCARAWEPLRATLQRRAARLGHVKSLCREAIRDHEVALRNDEAAVVQRARAVVATLTGAYFSPLLEGQRFDVVIVEEASMAILPTLFYAACLARDSTIMVGDPQQLPPIVLSNDAQVKRAMGRSIFDVTVPDPHASEYVVMLDTQYRMHPRIGDLISDLFYAGRLRHGAETRQRDLIAQRAPYPGEAMVIVDTAGQTRCETRQGSSSRRNEGTAELCVRLALEAVRAGAESIAVITPYADQAREIRGRLGRAGADARIECSTVHRFQGHERDLVIFDTVDSDPMRPGVLLNDTRDDSAARNLINVSLSRARGKLIVISDVEYFERHAPHSIVTSALRKMLDAKSMRVTAEL